MSTPTRAAATRRRGLTGGVREQMRHTVGRVAEGQRDAGRNGGVSRAHPDHPPTDGLSRTKRSSGTPASRRKGTADEVVHVGNVPRHIRGRGRHTGDTKRRDAAKPATASWHSRARRRPSAGNGRHARAANQEQRTRSAPGANPVCPAPEWSCPQGFPQVIHRLWKTREEGTATEQNETLRPPSGSLRTRPTAGPPVARKYSSTNCLTKQRHTVTGPVPAAGDVAPAVKTGLELVIRRRDESLVILGEFHRSQPRRSKDTTWRRGVLLEDLVPKNLAVAVVIHPLDGDESLGHIGTAEHMRTGNPETGLDRLKQPVEKRLRERRRNDCRGQPLSVIDRRNGRRAGFRTRRRRRGRNRGTGGGSPESSCRVSRGRHGRTSQPEETISGNSSGAHGPRPRPAPQEVEPGGGGAPAARAGRLRQGLRRHTDGAAPVRPRGAWGRERDHRHHPDPRRKIFRNAGRGSRPRGSARRSATSSGRGYRRRSRPSSGTNTGRIQNPVSREGPGDPGRSSASSVSNRFCRFRHVEEKTPSKILRRADRPSEEGKEEREIRGRTQQETGPYISAGARGPAREATTGPGCRNSVRRNGHRATAVADQRSWTAASCGVTESLLRLR